jgi:hypothetical protein
MRFAFVALELGPWMESDSAPRFRPLGPFDEPGTEERWFAPHSKPIIVTWSDGQETDMEGDPPFPGEHTTPLQVRDACGCTALVLNIVPVG